MDDPQVVSPEEWRAARIELLEAERELTRHRDEVDARRRRLPMVEVEVDYLFGGPAGDTYLPDMFEGRSQLVVYHFMWRHDRGDGCPSCALLVDSIGHLRHLHARDTTLALVSRAPMRDIERFRARMGWEVPWYSSYGSCFNYDFHVTVDESVAPVEYDFQDRATLEAEGPAWVGWSGERSGVSAFLRRGDRVFHTYSSYGRGSDLLIGTYNWLDLTPRGRQEDGEQPSGGNDGPSASWARHHDRCSGAPAR